MKAERKFRRHQIRKIVGNKFLQAEWEKYQKERGEKRHEASEKIKNAPAERQLRRGQRK